MDLREKRDVGAEIVSLDRGAHPGAPGADDEHVMRRFHATRPSYTEVACKSEASFRVSPKLSNGSAVVPCDSRSKLRRVHVPRPRPGGAGAAELRRQRINIKRPRRIIALGPY
jgi:hypothetical protein